MKSGIHLFFLSLVCPALLYPQVTLEADGPDSTYELINSVFAPGGNAVENPECAHPEFGRHIAEIWDTALNQYVFEFYIHVTPDNDRCINFDRQRVEIKTYEASPDNLKGVVGECISYRWKFRLPEGFQPSSSFTHIHQIKAVGGDDGNPIFTLTPRKATPNVLELIHNNSTKVATVPLAQFEGTWVECHEVITVGANGMYSMEIRKISDGTVLLSYNNDNLMTIRPDNDFIRPKWGMYRSLNNVADLRDEAMRFAGFSIQEQTTGVSIGVLTAPVEMFLHQNHFDQSNSRTTIFYSLPQSGFVNVSVLDLAGHRVTRLVNRFQASGAHQIDFGASFLPTGVYAYRLECNGIMETKKMILTE